MMWAVDRVKWRGEQVQTIQADPRMPVQTGVFAPEADFAVTICHIAGENEILGLRIETASQQ